MLDYKDMGHMLVPGIMVPMISRIDVLKRDLEQLRLKEEALFEDMHMAAYLLLSKRVRKNHALNLAEQGYGGFAMTMRSVWKDHIDYSLDTESIECIYKNMTQQECGDIIFREGVEEEIDELGNAYRKAKEKGDSHPLILISHVMYDFICMKPVFRGNLELSEIIVQYLLFDCGYDFGCYSQMEREGFRSVLQQAYAMQEAGGMSQGQALYSFTMGFLTWMEICYKKLEERTYRCEEVYLSKKDRVEALIKGSSVEMSKRDILESLPDVSVRTVETHLAELCKAGKIERLGGGRSTSYVWKEKAEGQDGRKK